MKNAQLTKLRLQQQLISHQPFTAAGDVVHALGAMQAQDFAGAKWSIALRLPQATEDDIDDAIAKKQVIRTWALRNTLHFVSPKDVRWMLSLLRDRLLQNAKSSNKLLGLDEKTLVKGLKVITNQLEGGNILTRDELGEALLQKKLAIDEHRLSHFLGRAAIDQLICFGPRRGKEFTFALLDEWAPATKPLEREEALATLASRYLTSHAPATIKDFSWWSGLTPTIATEAFELVKADFSRETIDGEEYWIPLTATVSNTGGSIHLLPGFDEYMLGYTNRFHVVDQQHYQKIAGTKNGQFASTVVINGKVAGVWKRTMKKNKLQIDVTPFDQFSPAREKAVTKAAAAYAKYSKLPLEISVY
ncbi:winged helix DNA-binding domain-containing protein [uncultured Chitinophaga sp.]|uniref:winged helix DNA-binding domain-containing protein n=1 Tax=uncultured Chitinophaga sp. TaxID=339340 RepID=UPI0025D7DA02|nr:winged helix DNA-binding domain-containing protein [uncultured Chitinophaga sp.]